MLRKGFTLLSNNKSLGFSADAVNSNKKRVKGLVLITSRGLNLLPLIYDNHPEIGRLTLDH